MLVPGLLFLLLIIENKMNRLLDYDIVVILIFFYPNSRNTSCGSIELSNRYRTDTAHRGTQGTIYSIYTLRVCLYIAVNV